MAGDSDALFEALRKVASSENAGQTGRHKNPELRELPVVRALVLERGASWQTAVTAALDAGARSLMTMKTASDGLMMGEVVAASLALGEWSEVSGLGNRLGSLGERRGRKLSTMRSRHKDGLVALAEALPLLGLEDVEGPVTDHAETGGSHVVESLRISHVISERVPRTTIKEYVVKATGDSVSWHEAVGHYPNDAREAAFTVRPIANCSLRARRPGGTGQHRYELRVPRTQPGRTVRFSYEYHVASDTPDRPYLRHLAAQRIDSCELGVQFELGDLPERIWWFANEDSFFEPLDSPPRRAVIPVNKVGYASVEVPQQQRYHYFGLAWSWKSETMRA